MQKEGRFALFKGLRPNFYRTIFHQLITANLYHVCKSDTIKASPNSDNTFSYDTAFVASSISRLIAMMVTYPLDVLKNKAMTEIAADTEPKYKRVILGLRYIFHSEGVIGLYRGATFKIYGMVLQAASVTAIYQELLDRNEDDNRIKNFALLSAINFALFYPLDTIIKNIQLQGFMGYKDSVVGARRVFKELVKPGYRSLYAGGLYYISNTALLMGCQRILFDITNK